MLGSLLVDETHCLRIARCESAIEYDSYDVQELNDEFATRCGLYGVLI